MEGREVAQQVDYYQRDGKAATSGTNDTMHVLDLWAHVGWKSQILQQSAHCTRSVAGHTRRKNVMSAE